MLGLRGVRLGLVIPGLFTMQVRAIAEAAAERKNAKGDPRAEIMIPLVGTVQEQEIVVPYAQPDAPEGAAAPPDRNDFAVESSIHAGRPQPDPRCGLGGLGEHRDKCRGAERKEKGTAVHVELRCLKTDDSYHGSLEIQA